MNTRGFTLVVVLIVLVIIALLAAAELKSYLPAPVPGATSTTGILEPIQQARNASGQVDQYSNIIGNALNQK